jgi:adenosylcobinamide-GDP ribazoletransferase
MSFLAAVAFLTVLPLPPAWRPRSVHLARATRWFPLVGLTIGGVLAGLDRLLGLLLNEPSRAALLVLAGLAISGALHFDGLMDTCDGYFAPVTPARRLEIMRDSHVGSFGVAAAGLMLLGKWAALLSLEPAPRWAALLLMALLSRWGLSLAIACFPAGRTEGLGYLVRAAFRPADLWIAAATALLAAVLILGPAGAGLWLALSLTVWLAGQALLRRLPGLTGDTYGALAELAELVSLILTPPLVRLLGTVTPFS